MYGKPYRGFESLSLRHTGWFAENFGSSELEILEIPRISSNSSSELDWREWDALECQAKFCASFSEGPMQRSKFEPTFGREFWM